MEIELEHVAYISARSLEGSHVPEHRQSGGERAIRGVERDVEDGRCVNNAMDGLEVIFC